jgi:Sigma-70, region 4
MTANARGEQTDRVVQRRRAVALARHYRDFEGLTNAEIAARLGRSPATVKAYFYDPSYANKGPYTSLGATRAVYGAPWRRKPTRASAGQNARRHGVAAPTRRPIHPALERAPRLVDRVGASVCGGGLNTGVHATPLEEE